MVCEELHAAANASGATAASAVGQRQVVSAAVAGEKLEALEGVLPVNTGDLLDLISKHAREGAKFVARQLLPLLDLMDMADAAARKAPPRCATPSSALRPRLRTSATSTCAAWCPPTPRVATVDGNVRS